MGGEIGLTRLAKRIGENVPMDRLQRVASPLLWLGTWCLDMGGALGAGASETDIVAATTITGDALCKATNVVYRTDTPSARNFLGGFVALP